MHACSCAYVSLCVFVWVCARVHMVIRAQPPVMGPHLPPCLRWRPLLVTTVCSRHAGRRASGDSPASDSHLSVGALDCRCVPPCLDLCRPWGCGIILPTISPVSTFLNFIFTMFYLCACTQVSQGVTLGGLGGQRETFGRRVSPSPFKC